mgnify:CR=1 FL=1
MKKKYLLFIAWSLILSIGLQAQISFTDSGQSLATYATDVVLGDFDNNTGLDALIPKGNNYDRVFFNDGSGNFSLSNPLQNIGGNNKTYQIAVGNFDDKGGANDVAIARNNGNIIWLNDGNGTYVGSGINLSATTSITVADLNNDGIDDIISASQGIARIYINNYTTTNQTVSFTLNQTITYESSGERFVNDLMTSDLDNDNNLDLIIASRGSSYILFGSGTNNMFNTTPTTLTNGIGATGIDVFDIDNNGFKDIVFSHGVDSNNVVVEPNKILLNSNGTSFSEMSSTPTEKARFVDVAFADFDNDNDIDIIFASKDTNHFIWENINGVYSSYSIPNSYAGLNNGLDIGDIDGDGDIDVIFANGSSSTGSKVYFNNLTTLKIDDVAYNSKITLYPNPVKNQFTISTENKIIKSVKVFNLQGQLVKSFKNNSAIYNIDDLTNGIYLVKVSTSNGNDLIKIIKE